MPVKLSTKESPRLLTKRAQLYCCRLRRFQCNRPTGIVCNAKFGQSEKVATTGSSTDETLSSLDALLTASGVEPTRLQPVCPVLPQTDAATQMPQAKQQLVPAVQNPEKTLSSLFDGSTPFLEELRQTSPLQLFQYGRMMAVKKLKDYVKPTKIVDENFVLPRVKPRVAYVVVALNIAVYLYGLSLRLTEGEEGPLRYFDSLANMNAGIEHGEYYRLLTSNFLHDSFVHLAVSSYALFTIAPEAESILGVLAFLTTYVLGGVAGSFTCFLLSDTITVGASTGIFGLIGAMGSFLYKNHRTPQSSDQVLFAAGTLLFNLFLGGDHETAIDNLGHMGGLVCGIYLGYLLTPLIESGSPIPPESEQTSVDSTSISSTASFPVDLSKAAQQQDIPIAHEQGGAGTESVSDKVEDSARQLRVYQPNPLQSFVVLLCVSLTLGSGVAATVLHRTGQLPLPLWPIF